MDDLTNMVVVLHKICEELKPLTPHQRQRVIAAALQLLQAPPVPMFGTHPATSTAAPMPFGQMITLGGP